jgi:hypothetical protein
MRSHFVGAMACQSTTKFLVVPRWFLGSLQRITDKFGDLTLQEPESRRIVGSGTDRLPLDPVQVSLINEAQLRHELSKPGKTDLDPVGAKTNHTLAVPDATTDPTYQSPSESNSEGSREVYMVWNGEEL